MLLEKAQFVAGAGVNKKARKNFWLFYSQD